MAQSSRSNGTGFLELIGLIVEGAWSIVVGHYITAKNFIRPGTTDQYTNWRAKEKNWKPAPGYRGDFALIAAPDRPGGLRCTACMQCANVCPDKCIHVEGDGKGKERHPVSFYIDIGLCQFCWMCAEICPFNAITMTPEYEQAEADPRKLIRDIEELRRRGADIPEPLRPIMPE
jgi:formate hydrogenlyase subunit 6/NADH:ubiquinone oxidoreductase subunit I